MAKFCKWIANSKIYAANHPLASGLVVDHTWCHPFLIPDTYRDLVKSNVKAIIVGQSHGHQWSHYGMDEIVADYPTFTRYQHYGLPLEATSALDMCVTFGASSWDHVFPHQYWAGSAESIIDWDLETNTEHPIMGYLDDNTDINVCMHVWCSTLRSSTSAYVEGYLRAMEALEAAYPNVTFIYMTGHAQFRTDDTTVAYTDADGLRQHKNNAIIRNYCIAHHKILIDSADMDIYCPYLDGVIDPDNYTWVKENDRSTTTTYNGVEITESFSPVHLAGWGPYDGSPSYAHTSLIHCQMKSQALWKLFATLQGWRGMV